MNQGAPQPWWKAAKESSLARKAATLTPASFASPGDSFLIVTEGTVTEPVYLELFRKSLQLATVTVKIQPGRASHPKHVIQSAADEVAALARRVENKQTAVDEVEKYDHVWAVIDTDVAVREGIWSDVQQLAASRSVSLAHSTPCFEFWLLLHLKNTAPTNLINGDIAKKTVKEALGCEYSTNKEVARQVMPRFLATWADAVKRAQRVRKNHLDADTPSPGNPSTDVDLLVCALNDATPEHFRKAEL